VSAFGFTERGAGMFKKTFTFRLGNETCAVTAALVLK